MIELAVADLNSQAIEATLDDVMYYIILNWNQAGGYWTIGFRNAGYRTLVTGISVSANFDLISQFKYSDMPAGAIFVLSYDVRSGPVPRDGFSSGNYHLVYMTEDELRTGVF